MPPVFLEHPTSLEHDTGSHPEHASRITAIRSELERQGWLGLEPQRSPAVERSVLEAVHPPGYVEAIERVCAAGGGHLDVDTVVSERSFEAALYGSGGAVELVRMLSSGEAPYGLSAHRPPGHHATRSRAMGFCLFNHVAVAAQYALDACDCERVLILDWDVHHGNGTNDIFHASDRVLFVSIHQSPLYPGTGSSRDVGSGPGAGFTVNLPVSAGSGDAVYQSLLEHVVAPLALSFEPQLVLVSAGYDAHRDDPLADCRVTDAGYAEMTRTLQRVCAQLGAPVGLVLEGGYALAALARSVAITLEVLGHPVADGSAPPPLLPEAEEARARLAAWWPGFA